jgi:hypothetical protein
VAVVRHGEITHLSPETRGSIAAQPEKLGLRVANWSGTPRVVSEGFVLAIP